jgi:hypothetical protein
MDEIGEFDGVLDEEDRDVVADYVCDVLVKAEASDNFGAQLRWRHDEWRGVAGGQTVADYDTYQSFPHPYRIGWQIRAHLERYQRYPYCQRLSRSGRIQESLCWPLRERKPR